MDDRRPTRRALLAAGATTAVAAVAGCGRAAAPVAVGATGSASTTGSPTSAAVVTTTAKPPATWAVAVAAGERGLLASYDAVTKAHPSLKTALAPLRAAHAAHVKALKVSGKGKALAGLPAGQAQALSRLAAAEQNASDTTAAVCVTCPTEAAALLGSIAAADASHVVLLHAIGAK
ncbi:MAG: hypothetical protein QOD91_1842 [Frankiales bacterium]|jgi:hypothetical protein|nr:hypothetical protein [Frankiales bacterium]